MTEVNENLQRKAFTLYQILSEGASVESFTDDPKVELQINAFSTLGDIRIAYVSVIGSHNYRTDIEGSDVDYKVAYYPRFRHFYNNNFPKFSIVTDDFDISMNPVHEVHKHMLKANMNAFEPLFSDYCFADINMDSGGGETYFKRMRYLVNANVKKALLAAYWTAVRNHKEIERDFLYVTGPEWFDKNPELDYKVKKAAMAARMLAYARNLLYGYTIGESVMVDVRYRDFIKEIKEGKVEYSRYLRWYEAELEEVRHLMFVDGDDEAKVTRRVEEMDETETGRYEVNTKVAHEKLMSICKENM